MRYRALLPVLLLMVSSPTARGQFSAPLPKRKVPIGNSNARYINFFGDTSSQSDVPNLILPQIGTGFSNDRAYLVGTAITAQGEVGGHGFNLDLNGARVVSSSDDADPLKRQAIRDTKGVVTLLIENSGEVGIRLYGCPGGCAAGAASSSAGNNQQKLLFGVTAGSYNGPNDARKDPNIAFGPIAQYYAAIGLSNAADGRGIGHFLVGARVGAIALGAGPLSDVPDSKVVRYASETMALVVNSAILFGVTLTQTQGSLKPFIPGVQITSTASLK